MEGTIILASIFLLVDLFILAKYHRACKDIQSREDIFLLILSAVLLFLMFWGESYIVRKQYRFDKEGKSSVIYPKEQDSEKTISFYWGTTKKVTINKGLH